MPVDRYNNSYRTYFSKKLLTYYEASRQQRYMRDLGIEHVRVATVTTTPERVEQMLDALNRITDGRGSSMFLFTNELKLAASKVRRHAPWRPRAITRERRQLRRFAQLGRLAVRAEWRRGVGRQARQSGGCIALILMRFLKISILKMVQVSRTFPLPCLMASRTVGRLRCSTARRGQLDGGCSTELAAHGLSSPLNVAS